MLLEGSKVAQQWWIKWGKKLEIVQVHHRFLRSCFNRLSCCCEKHIAQRNGSSHTGWEKCCCQAASSLVGCPLPFKPESLCCRKVDHALLLWLNSDEPGDNTIRAGVCYPGKFHGSSPCSSVFHASCRLCVSTSIYDEK